ncbi:Fc receptor-like protein 2 isoform X2 [Lynx rufus]|uniref:Fc receptor-like protein 2 isoform X2 n=1 Tax=Lynx rufus TaxID=61384 RepID=UPI001F124E15|nr:Fc receptor-like protein 2 isoform X2 [Lynx rufus]
MLLWSLLVIFAPVDGKSDWLTLVAPSAVFEGDRIDLTCQRKNDWWKVKRVSYYKDGEELQFSSELSNFSIQRAVLSDSGTYHCAVAPVWPLFPFQKEKTSRSVRIEVQELFPRPVLTVSPFQAIEGNPVTLTCETKLSPQRSDAQLRFCFFRDGRALGSGWSSSPELRVPAMWSGDSGSYWCEAETVTPSVRKQSLQSQIHVRRVPVSNVSLEMRAPRGQVIEGRNLVLLCSVTEGTGNITFSWHREATGTSVGKKTQRSLSVELEVPAVQERDAGRYYCRADNGHGPIQSKVLSILVRIPASCPILSITAPRAQAVEGDVVELRCEAQRGSPPILYRFYHEDVPLGNSSAPSGGGASLNLSLTAEHSGNYSCEADNGLGARRSEVVPLSLSGTSSYREEQVTDRALGLLGVPACVAAALLFYCRFHKTRGRHSVCNALRDVPSANSQASTPSSPSPAIEDLQPDYVNVDPGDGDVAYSFVWSVQLPEDSENTRRTILENKDPHVIYSGVKEM